MAKGDSAAPAAFVPKVKRKLTMPVLKLQPGKTVYVKVTGAIYEGKPIKGQDDKKKPADLMQCVNMETGEECLIVVPAVVKSVLEDDYADASYVGKGFSICKGEKQEGKAYFPYQVEEIEV